MSYKEDIYKLGCKLVNCDKSCEGINKINPNKGILPRCLIFENTNHQKERGSIIVGINPGRSKIVEREYYIKNGQSYNSIVTYWEKQIRDHAYYNRLRTLTAELELNGPILWTELAKCENGNNKSGLLPLQTFRMCMNEYLRHEIGLLPSDWPILAIGKETYKALAYIYHDRSVLGIPHPTGSYGYFPKLFENGDIKKDLLPEIIIKTKQNYIDKTAIWFHGK